MILKIEDYKTAFEYFRIIKFMFWFYFKFILSSLRVDTKLTLEKEDLTLKLDLDLKLAHTLALAGGKESNEKGLRPSFFSETSHSSLVNF